MNRALYELSDQLFQLRRDFMPHEVGGVFLSDMRVRQLTAGLMQMAQAALRDAHEISRHRWNDKARAERQQDEVLLLALDTPGSNIVLFEPAGRPSSDQPGAPA